MVDLMLDRILITLVLVALGSGAYVLFQQLQRRRLSQFTASIAQPSVLYFRSDTCASCGTQKRYLEQLAERIAVNVETIDVMREPERASRFNVMTLPTTIVVDGRGAVRQINFGLTDVEKLTRQLES